LNMYQPSFPQNRVKRLLLALKASLGRGTGASLTFDEWGEMVGRPGNTLSSWCADGEAHQIQVLLGSARGGSTSGCKRFNLLPCRVPFGNHESSGPFPWVQCGGIGSGGLRI
jgi:hypothetical protein